MLIKTIKPHNSKYKECLQTFEHNDQLPHLHGYCINSSNKWVYEGPLKQKENKIKIKKKKIEIKKMFTSS